MTRFQRNFSRTTTAQEATMPTRRELLLVAGVIAAAYVLVPVAALGAIAGYLLLLACRIAGGA